MLMIRFPGRDDGWRDIPRGASAEQVRRDILHQRYLHASRMAYDKWVLVGFCMGMGGLISQENFDEVQAAIDWAEMCRSEWLGT